VYLIDTYPDTFAGINVHLSDAYATSWGDMRWDLYDGYYIPHSVHDGLYDADPYTTYETKFLTRQAVPTDVTIDTQVFGGGDTWKVYVEVCIEAGGVGKDLKIWVAQILDHYLIGTGSPVRNALQTGNAGVDVTLAPDQCAYLTETFVLDAPSVAQPDDVKFFAWAQDPTFFQVPTSGPPWGYYSWSEVHQAAKALAPFEGVFTDGLEDGTTDAWSSVVP
jgi:hypothetical protein